MCLHLNSDTLLVAEMKFKKSENLQNQPYILPVDVTIQMYTLFTSVDTLSKELSLRFLSGGPITELSGKICIGRCVFGIIHFMQS